MIQITDLKMAVDATFSSIINEIQLSNLNFSLQMTPFAAYITLKKSVIKDVDGIQAFPSPPILLLLQQANQTIDNLQEENKQLKIETDAAHKNNENLVNDNAALVEAVQASDTKLAVSKATNHSLHEKLAAAEKEILKVSSAKHASETEMKDAKKSHLQEINKANSIIKTLEKGGKGLEKEIHNLRRSLENTRDTIKTLKNEHSSLKINKNKLEAKIKKLEKVASQKDLKIMELTKKENTDINQNLSNSLCSSTSSTTNSCNPEPTSVPSFTSMVAHWNPPLYTPSPLMPNSITTMVTHCLRLPSPTFLLCSAQEYQEMINRIIERAFANLRWSPLDAENS